MSTRRPASRATTPVPPAPEPVSEPASDNGANGQRKSIDLGPNDRLVGQLYIEGDLRVSGTIEGAVEATGDIEIAGRGKVSGAVTAYNRLTVGGAASLIGEDVRIGRLTVEDGATFSGRVTMGKHEASVPAKPQPVAEPVAAELTPTDSAPTEPAPTEPIKKPVPEAADLMSTPRASVGWTKRRKK